MAASVPSSSRRKASKRPPAVPVEMSAASNGLPRLFDSGEVPSSAKKTKLTEEEARSKVKEEPAECQTQVPPPLVLDWSTDDLAELVSRISVCLPKNDNAKYSTLVEKLDWDKICFRSYTSIQCKAKWNQVMTRLRRYRTLTDMVTDAREWLKHPWLSNNNSRKQQKHPEMPKKPLTPYFQYFLEKREKYSREHPSMSMTDLAKILSKKFQQLPEKKKQKYKDSYERESEIYKMELERFKKDHPEEFPQENHVASGGKTNGSASQAQADHGAPTKPMTPFQFFTADRLKRPDYLQLEKKEAIERTRKQWNVLSDGKRIKWIRRAVQDVQRYELEVNGYAALHPDFKADTTKTFLSKAEKELKDKYDGKPERPPNSGYSLFSRIMLRELKDFPAKEKMAEISRRWKDLGETERTNYNKQAQKANQRYKEKYAIYVNSLDEEDRQKLLAETSNAKGQKKEKVVHPAEPVAQLSNGTSNHKNEEVAKKESSKSPPALNLSKKPSSTVIVLDQEKIAALQQKHPGLSKQELTLLIAREFAEVPEKKKEKTKKQLDEAKQPEVKKTTVKSEEVVETQGKKKLFKGEPRKPPQSGYGVFSSEMLSILTTIDPKQRMAEIAKRWKAMASVDQDKYKKRSQDLLKKYSKELTIFINGLSEEELKEYYRFRKGPKSKAAPAVTKPQGKNAVDSIAKQKRQKPETESSDEDGEKEVAGGEEDDSSSDDEEGSDQSENEDSGSGSDESGSDSDEEDSDDDDDDDEPRKEKQNDSSSEESGSESGSSEESSDSGSDSDEEE